MKLQTFNRSVSLRTLQNFYEHFFWRISTKGCFCKLTKKTNSNQTTNLCYLFLKPRKNICKSPNFLNFIVLTEKCYVDLNFILTWFSIIIRTFHKPIIIGIKSSKNVCRYAIHLNYLSTSTNFPHQTQKKLHWLFCNLRSKWFYQNLFAFPSRWQLH